MFTYQEIQNFEWVSGVTPLTDFRFFVGIHLFFMALFVFLHFMMKNREPVKLVGHLSFFHSVSLSVISFLFFHEPSFLRNSVKGMLIDPGI